MSDTTGAGPADVRGMLRSGAGLLALYFVLAAFGNMQHAWGYQLGDPVEKMRVQKPCSYFSKSGSFADCTGKWTTSDGQAHTGELVGSITDDVGTEDKLLWRAGGDTAYTPPSTWVKVTGLPAPFAGGLAVLLLLLSFLVRRTRQAAQPAS